MVKLTFEFPNATAALEALRRLIGEQELTHVHGVTIGNDFADRMLKARDIEPPKVRKPRNDAGKPRGPYKTTGEPAASEPGKEAGIPPSASTPAAPATPTKPAATQPPETASAKASSEGDGKAPGAANPAPAAAAELTIDDARLALSNLNDTKGKGMEACINLLRAFGVQRVSDLKKEKYAEFVAAVAKEIGPKK